MSDDMREGRNMSESSETTNQVDSAGQKASISRRKFAKLGLLGAPLIMTLNSRPVLGAYQCTVSGQQSGNLSNVDASVAQCLSQSEDLWADPSVVGTPDASTGIYRTHLWPHPFTPETPFHSVFQSTFPYNYGAATMIQVMYSAEPVANGGLDILDDNKVGLAALGALLNAEFYGQKYFGYDTNWVINTWNTWPDTTLALAQFFSALNLRWASVTPHPDQGPPV